jgi:hypothetical protein
MILRLNTFTKLKKEYSMKNDLLKKNEQKSVNIEEVED